MGFGRSMRPCAARTCLFWLINTQNGELCALPRPSQQLPIHPPKNKKINYYISGIWNSGRPRMGSPSSWKATKEKICCSRESNLGHHFTTGPPRWSRKMYSEVWYGRDILVRGKIREKSFYNKKDRQCRRQSTAGLYIINSSAGPLVLLSKLSAHH